MLLVLASALAFSTQPVSMPRRPPTEIAIEAVPAPANRSADPELICREWQYPGTRLLTRRVCGTKADWRTYRQNLRYDMDRAAVLAAGF